ncbi:MAG: DUF4396 domain-containing protein [Gammaproteobacteria bacterium]|nr:DUF4396 domain-containing protein [Gammaproteobacteria bacterium]
MEAAEQALQSLLTDHRFLVAWAVAVAVALGALARDLARRNRGIAPLMRAVWILTVLYSGPVGLWVYWVSGRRQIRTDSIWRRGARSTAHCYSGCGAGEIAGITIAAGLLALGNLGTALITFALAYAFGFAMTVGPLVQEGVAIGRAMWDAFASETASITVMEVVAIGVDLWLAGGAGMSSPLFWSSLVVSLTAGLAAAYPVNVALIGLGVKEGMHDPRETGGHAR